MGSYILSKEEIAEAFERADIDHFCEGDYTEKTFVEGAYLYIAELRKKGASIPRGYSRSKKLVIDKSVLKEGHQ